MAKKPTYSHYIEYFIMLFMQQIIRLLPLKFVVYFAKYLARFITFFIKIRNEIVMNNLAVAFPDMSVNDKIKIRDKMYENIFISSFESYKYMYLTKEQKIKHLLIDSESRKTLFRGHNENIASIGVGGHFGFFEGGGHYCSSFGVKTSFVVANQKNKLTEKLIDLPRKKAGIGVIHRKSMRQLIEAIRNKHLIALLSDQDAGRKGLFVDFFGKKASTHKNAAVLALKYNIPLLLVSTVRDKKDITKHHLIFREIMVADIADSNMSKDKKIFEIVQRYTKAIEDEIRKNPDHYWWIHKRFKTKEKK